MSVRLSDMLKRKISLEGSERFILISRRKYSTNYHSFSDIIEMEIPSSNWLKNVPRFILLKIINYYYQDFNENNHFFR